MGLNCCHYAAASLASFPRRSLVDARVNSSASFSLEVLLSIVFTRAQLCIRFGGDVAFRLWVRRFRAPLKEDFLVFALRVCRMGRPNASRAVCGDAFVARRVSCMLHVLRPTFLALFFFSVEGFGHCKTRGLKKPALGFALGKDTFRPLSLSLALSFSTASLSIGLFLSSLGVVSEVELSVCGG